MRFFLLSLSLLLSGIVYAGNDIVFVKKTGTDIAVGTPPMVVNGTRYLSSLTTPAATRTYWTEDAMGLIKLSCPTAFTASQQPSGNAKVSLTVNYLVEQGGTFISKTETITLELQFGATVAKDIAYFKLPGAQYLNVTINSKTIPGSWPSLELEASVTTNSFDLLNVNPVYAPGSLSHDAVLTKDGNLKINWETIAGAEKYELEWTYVSDQDGTNPALRLTADKIEVDRFIFRNNSSRVEVSGLTYEIPMIYERGIILYRLRGIGKNISNSVPVLIKTQWTAPDGMYGLVSDYVNRYVFDGLEQKLNWQSSLSFAEEGKSKVVLSYHDGSSRNRQAVTRINTDKRAIVGETIYDYNGRPVVQTLPVPVTENTLTYFPNFNLVENKTKFDKADFDKAVAGDGCTPASPALSIDSGASRYYSANNPFKTAGNQGVNMLNRNLVPDAEKFPYTQTFYTPDNTGRIAAQSGVGKTYRIGTGRETKYLYGSPLQPELSRLFGVQVGYAPHYKKNVVVDPNGQTSVSYLDLDGKVVATALAGGAPDSLIQLTGENGRTIKTDLLSSGSIANQLSTDRLAKIYSNKFAVTGTNIPYKFNYTAIVGKYDLQCETPQTSGASNVTMDGVIDVELQLVDKCGTELFNKKQSSSAGHTGANQTITFSQNETLQPTEYQIVKTLKINEAALEKYWEDYLDKSNCLLTDSAFIKEELTKRNILGCGLICDSCQKEVTRILNGNSTLSDEERDRISHLCDEICDQSVGCRSYLESMKGDMVPGGQYGQLRKDKLNQNTDQAKLDENNQPVYTSPDIKVVSNDPDEPGFDVGNPADNVIDVKQFPLSIYNPSNSLKVPPVLRDILPASSNWSYFWNYQYYNRVSWRNPIAINIPNYGRPNWHNQVLYDQNVNLKEATYAITDYTDQNGAIFYVSVYKLNDGTNDYYKPEVTDQSKLIVVDAGTGLYKIPVKYLAKLEDLEKYWQPHWADYLVVYHPEYEYLVECTGQQKSMAFDYELVNATTIIEAMAIRSDGTRFVNAAGEPMIVGTETRVSLDPFLKGSPAYDKFLKQKNDVYQTNPAVPAATPTVTMAQMATITVGCPRMVTGCGFPGCMDGKIDTDDEWNAYKSLYLSEKQKLIRNQETRKAVDNNYYNGCIGHVDYLTNADGAYFRTPQTRLNPQIAKDWQCPQDLDNFGNWTWYCREISYLPYTRVTNIPYLNPAQLCYGGRPEKFVKKTQRFYPSAASGSAGQTAQNCTELVDNEDPSKDPVRINVPCEDNIRETLDLATEEAKRFKYESCGQCPVASDLEQFIMDLQREGKLVSSTNLLVTCELPIYKVKLGEEIRRQLLLMNSNSLNIYWKSTLSPDKKVLSGQFIGNNGVDVLATLNLAIPDIAATASYTFESMPDMCCLAMPVAVGSEVIKTFKMKSNYYDEVIRKDRFFYLEGDISLQLYPCEPLISPRCYVTDDTRRILFLLNVLCVKADILSDKTHDLLTNNTEKPLLDNDVKDYYIVPVRNILKKENDAEFSDAVIESYNPEWASYITAGATTTKLNGVLSSTIADIVIEIDDLPSAYLYSDIKEFSNIRPQKLVAGDGSTCWNQNCVNDTFLADALIENTNERKFFTVKIKVPAMKPIVCKPTVPARRSF